MEIGRGTVAGEGHCERQRSVSNRLRMGWACGRGLAVAHRRAVIHGDIKPANILITNENRVKLTDFGMARLASHQTDSAVRGTPAYWCPEQILGRAQDARSDLFSLGVVLHEMLTGVNPFAGDTFPRSATRFSPLHRCRRRALIRLSRRLLDDIVASCLAKEPQLRMHSAEALAERLFPFARRSAAPVQTDTCCETFTAFSGRPPAAVCLVPARFLRHFIKL